MLIVQIYWVIGASLASDTVSIPKELKQIRQKILARQDILVKGNQDVTEDGEIKELEAELSEKGNELNTTYRFLHLWNNIGWRLPVVVFQALTTEEEAESTETNSDEGGPGANQASQVGGGVDPYDERNRINKSAQFALNAIQEYLLPLLYGLLGAYAFILRALATGLKYLSFDENPNTYLKLRISMGILAGLAIGWFFIETGTESSLSIGALSPLALAFLAGYGVELLFSFLDKLITTFTSKKPIQS
jgi:hypothetical protein